MPFSVQSFTIDPDHQWRFSDREIDTINSGILAQSNGTTNFGKLARGQVLSRLANGKVRPTVFSPLTEGVSAVNVLPLEDVSGAFVGDVVDIVAGSTPGVTIVAGADTTDMVVVPKKAGLSLNLVVSGNNTVLSHSYVQATGVIEVNSATDGGGAATTTLAELAALLETVYGSLIESATPDDGTKILVDVGPTSLGRVKGEVIAAARTVSAVDRAEGEITVGGGALTLITGDIVRLPLWQPVGILDRAERTNIVVDGEVLPTDVSCKYATHGDAIPSKLAGWTEALRASMSGGQFADLDGTTLLVSNCAFIFREL